MPRHPHQRLETILGRVLQAVAIPILKFICTKGQEHNFTHRTVMSVSAVPDSSHNCRQGHLSNLDPTGACGLGSVDGYPKPNPRPNPTSKTQPRTQPKTRLPGPDPGLGFGLGLGYPSTHLNPQPAVDSGKALETKTCFRLHHDFLAP